MKDIAVTAHPVLKTSTVYALEQIAEDNNITIGRAIELCLEKCEEFKKQRDVYKNSKLVFNSTTSHNHHRSTP